MKALLIDPHGPPADLQLRDVPDLPLQSGEVRVEVHAAAVNPSEIKSADGQVEHRLDWFHLRRRIEWLGRSIRWAIDYGNPDWKARLNRYGETCAVCNGIFGITGDRGTRVG